MPTNNHNEGIFECRNEPPYNICAHITDTIQYGLIRYAQAIRCMASIRLSHHKNELSSQPDTISKVQTILANLIIPNYL